MKIVFGTRGPDIVRPVAVVPDLLSLLTHTVAGVRISMHSRMMLRVCPALVIRSRSLASMLHAPLVRTLKHSSRSHPAVLSQRRRWTLAALRRVLLLGMAIVAASYGKKRPLEPTLRHTPAHRGASLVR